MESSLTPSTTTPPTEQRRRIVSLLWVILLGLVLAFLVIYPVSMLLLGALTTATPLVQRYHLEDACLVHLDGVLVDPNILFALLNSLLACSGATASALSSAARRLRSSSKARGVGPSCSASWRSWTC